jgi:plastocyanin
VPKKVSAIVVIGLLSFPFTVAPGDTIVSFNKDLVPDTATSTAGSFDSKDTQADKSWKYTIRKTGDFAYICTFHPTMKAMLRVTS